MPSLVFYRSFHLLNVLQLFLLSFFKAYGILVSWKKKRTTPFHILSKTYIYLCETFISCDHIFIWCNQPIPVWFRFDTKVVILSMTYTLSLSTPWKPISLKWPVLILLIHLYCSPTAHSPRLNFGVCLCICYHPHFKLSLDFYIIGVSAPDLYRYFLYLSVFWYLFLDFTGFFFYWVLWTDFVSHLGKVHILTVASYAFACFVTSVQSDWVDYGFCMLLRWWVFPRFRNSFHITNVLSFAVVFSFCNLVFCSLFPYILFITMYLGFPLETYSAFPFGKSIFP